MAELTARWAEVALALPQPQVALALPQPQVAENELEDDGYLRPEDDGNL